MSIRITSLLLTSPVALPSPASYNLRPRETKYFPFIEYDRFVNDPRIADLLQKKVITIENLDGPGSEGDYTSEWNAEPKIRLQPYVFWLDATGSLRTKFGADPTNDLDGYVIGPAAGFLQVKAGATLAASFAGNPKVATVTFATPYVSANYSVGLCCVTSANVQFAPAAQNKTAAGFTINLGANNTNGLVEVNWTTTPYGEV